ncbi:MAG: PLP-dependent cysteine synthase family protein [Chloroflexota bacterium]
MSTTSSVVSETPIQSSSAITDITQMIGNTPLIRLRSLEPRTGVEVYGKAEWFNPGGSVKDRPALAMIEEGERSGQLTRDKIIIDATSGNTGIAYAMIGAARGYQVKLFMSAAASEERKRILRAYGAELVLTDPAESSDGAIREVRRRFEESPDIYFYPDQYNNPENWRAHFRTTGVEIFNQTGGRITHFVAGLGTSGTFVGVSRRLKTYCEDIQTISVQPDMPLHGLEGLKHMESAIVPGIYDETLADQDIPAGTDDAYRMVKRIASEEGILLGVSGGAALVGAEKVAQNLDRGVIVTILPDSGDRYLSDRFWDEVT